MKIVLLIEKLISIGPRVVKGIKDIKHLKNALKKNKDDDTDTPRGEVDYVRLLSTISAILSLGFGVAYAFGKIPEDTYQKLLEVLAAFTNE